MTAVYPTASVPEVVAGEVLGATVLPVTAPSLVTVRTDEDGTTVTAQVGVTAAAPAHETGRAVQAAIADYLDRAESPRRDITVRIGIVG